MDWTQRRYPECKILCRKDTAQTLLVINDKDTVCPLGGAELGGIGHAHALRYGESGGGFEPCDSTLDRLL